MFKERERVEEEDMIGRGEYEDNNLHKFVQAAFKQPNFNRASLKSASPLLLKDAMKKMAK